MGDAAAGAGPDEEEFILDLDIPIEEGFLAPDDSSAFIALITAQGITADRKLLYPPNLRTGEKDPFWLTEEGTAILESVGKAEFLLKSLTELVIHFTDSQTVECLKKNFDGNLRDAFERNGPQVQCRGTIGGVVEGETPCWICGFQIYSDHPFTRVELEPECEHVFPVAQALCFTGLYENQLFKQLQDFDPESSMATAYVQGVRLEYEWAHRICNQVKSNTHFIDISAEGQFVIVDEKIEAFLNEILNTKSYGTGAEFAKLIKKSKPIPQWKAERTAAIRARCEPLLQAAAGAVAGENMSPAVLACNVVMSMRSFIASTGKCVSLVEVIPPLPGMTEESTALAIEKGRRGRLELWQSPLTSREPVAVGTYFFTIGVEQVTGLIAKSINSMGRGSDLTASLRAQYLAYVLQKSKIWTDDHIYPASEYAKVLRDKIAYRLIVSRGVTSETPYVAAWSTWSEIQTQCAIVIQVVMYEEVVTNLIPGLMQIIAADPEFPESEETRALFLTVTNRPETRELISEWLTVRVQKVTDIFQIPYRDIVSQEVPATNDWKPNWYQAGGFRKRRPMYTRVPRIKPSETRRVPRKNGRKSRRQ